MHRIASLLLFAVSCAVVNAHFDVLYPPVRGEINESEQGKFCGGYTNATTHNEFPLDGGRIVLHYSDKSTWTAGVFISKEANPSSLDQFNTKTMAVPFFRGDSTSAQTHDDQLICIPLNFSQPELDVKDGDHVTIQVQFTGEDGDIFQCADVKVSSQATVPADTPTCPKTQVVPSAGSPSIVPSSGSAPAPSQSSAPGSNSAPKVGMNAPILAALAILSVVFSQVL